MKNIGFCKAKVLNLIVVILAIATCIVYGMADAKVNSPFIIGYYILFGATIPKIASPALRMSA